MGRSDRGLRLLVAAFGDPGHAFPAIALARELSRRGHEVLVETWERWREAVEGEGLAFTGAQEYTVYPPPSPDTPDGQTAAAAARALARLMEEFEPDLVVSDILTLAPTLAAEVAGVPHATLIPARVSGAAARDAALFAGAAAAADRVRADGVAGHRSAAGDGVAAGAGRAQ